VDTVHECDRQTDRQTEFAKTVQRIASHGKNDHNFGTGLPIDVMSGSRLGFPAELRLLP